MNITNEGEIISTHNIKENNVKIDLTDEEALEILLETMKENPPTR